MATLKFASSHNMVAFLDKPTESDGFEQITTAKEKTINGEVQIQALVDKKKVIITETSIRSDLQLEDAQVFLDKQVEGMSKRKEIYVTPSHTKKVFANMKSVPTHSNDPLLSGEDRLKLNELMELCTSLSQRVLDLEKTKTSQAAEIT
ncbi:hypothetical protein Tco_0520470 [Tanacetum coccineum]